MVSAMLEPAGSGLPASEFNLAGISRIVAEHRSARADHSHVIWLLLNYVAWRQRFLGG
jgi:hypothetical protein